MLRAYGEIPTYKGRDKNVDKTQLHKFLARKGIKRRGKERAWNKRQSSEMGGGVRSKTGANEGTCVGTAQVPGSTQCCKNWETVMS